MNIEELASRLLNQDKRALARAISLIEDGGVEARALMKRIYPNTGRAAVVGVTGAPGVGKSTLVDGLTAYYRQQGLRVGVLAVDPTSPFTGGAILGDRIRMQERGTDPDVFIRSLASRGQVGGLSRATGDSIRAMDAFGKDIILVETVGAGQGEVEVMRYAHTTLVVLMPGGGDEIQAIKAGILEIGDILVVNKADMEGADRLVRDLEMMLDLGPESPWRPPVMKTVASRGAGVAALAEKIEEHRQYLISSGGLDRKKLDQVSSQVEEIVASSLLAEVMSRARAAGTWQEVVDRLSEGTLDPYTAAEEVLSRHGLLSEEG